MTLESMPKEQSLLGSKVCVSQMHTYHNHQHIWFIISFNLTNNNKFQLMPMQTLEEIVAIDLGKNHERYKIM